MLYFGVVEQRSIADPYKIGRCKVRVIGVHSDDTAELPTDQLPWALPLMGADSAGIDGIGNSPTGILEGSWVVVQFADEFKQQPIIMGTIAGKPLGLGGGGSYDSVDSPEQAPTESAASSGSSTNAAAEPAPAPGSEPGSAPVGPPPAPGTAPGSPARSAATASAGAVMQPADIPRSATPEAIEFVREMERLCSVTPHPKKKIGNSSADDNLQIYSFLDNVKSGIYTIGYGNTTLSNGEKVTATTTMTHGECKALLAWHMTNRVVSEVRRKVKVPITASMWTALVSMAWQLGNHGLTGNAAFSILNRGDYEGFSKAIFNSYQPPEWVNVKDPAKRIDRMKSARRRAEYNMFIRDGFPDPKGGVIDPKAQEAVPVVAPDGSVDYSKSQPQAAAFTDPNSVYPRLRNESGTSRLARGTDSRDSSGGKRTIVDQKDAALVHNVPVGGGGEWDQPPIAYGALWPYNHVRETESGHVVEFDDTPGRERIAEWHRTGTYREIDSNGTRVNRIVGDTYEIQERNGYLLIKGDCNITVLGDCNLYTENDMNIEARGDLSIAASGNIAMAAGGNMVLGAKGTVNLEAGGVTSIEGSQTYINSGRRSGIKLPSARSAGKADFPPLGNYNRDADIMTTDDDVGGPSAATQSKYPAAFRPEAPREQQEPNGPFKAKAAKPVEEAAAPKGGGNNPAVIKTSLTGSISPDMQVSRHFKLKQFTCTGMCPSPAAITPQLGLTREQIVNNLQFTATNCLDPIFERFGKFQVNSWFRSIGNNGRLGSDASKTSHHLYGMAVDISWPEIKNDLNAAKRRAQEIIDLGIPFDQILIEKKNTCWIHISVKPTGVNRRQVKVIRL